MEEIVAAVKKLFRAFAGKAEDSIEKLPQSGGDRIYFRIYLYAKSYIATYNINVKENETFIYFSGHFREKQLPVPEVFAVNEEETIYIQQDLGKESLLDQLEQHGFNTYTYDLYCQTLSRLAKLQVKGDEGLDYNQCLTAKEFGKQAIMSDLLYFKYYFLDALKTPYDKQALLEDFETLSNYLNNSSEKYFLFRDFQSRNVIVNKNNVHFIDFQGGMKGAVQYDVASLLWQAKARLSDEWKERLLEYYIDELEALLNKPVDRQLFKSQYSGYVLIRLLQVLGAYGFRGLFERKAHFLTSIPLALHNLASFIKKSTIDCAVPEFERLLKLLSTEEVISSFENVKATEETALVVKINSFSYKKGLPTDDTDNGGGFMFDMRGILNPGRFEEFKWLTGRDKAVQDFLEQRTKMNEFMNGVYSLVDISVEDYIKRNFASLMINFGCTGGQHRSVYAADALARHLKNKYGVKVKVNHLVQDARNWINNPPVEIDLSMIANTTNA